MEQTELNQRILSRFDMLSTDGSSKTRVVFWKDATKEFADSLGSLDLGDVILLTWDGYNSFEIKYKVEVKSPKSRFLIYLPGDLPSDCDNILADTMLYSHPHFSADKVACLCTELGISTTCSDVIRGHIKFFESTERKNKLLKLGPKTDNPDEILLAMLSTVLGLKSIEFEDILKSMICSISDNPVEDADSLMQKLYKYDLEDEFWSICNCRFGYHGDDFVEFIFELFITAAVTGTPVVSSDILSRYILPSVHVSSFINHVLSDSGISKEIQSIIGYIDEKVKFTNILSKFHDNLEISDVGVFSSVDDCLSSRFISQLCSTYSPLDVTSKQIIEKRLNGYSMNVKIEYDAILAASRLIELCQLFTKNIDKLDKTKKLIDDYAEIWYEVDYQYRHFIFYSDQSDNDSMDELRTFVENTYTNNFLNPIITKLCSQVKTFSDLPEPYQFNFCDRYIDRSHQKTVVIISDAFRYECAVELNEELGKTSRVKERKLEYMISTLPSITSFGMSSLLPNDGLTVSSDESVKIGDCSVDTSEKREFILKSKYPDSIVFTYKQLKDEGSRILKERCKGKHLIYIYHNTIDAVGESLFTENKVFDACLDAIIEIKELIFKITNWNYTKFIITADHGFIYRRSHIKECDQIDVVKGFGNGFRYSVNDRPFGLNQSIEMSLDYLNGSGEGLNNEKYVAVPNSASVFKQPGAGNNYVHGGLSPQEALVPVIIVNTKIGSISEKYVGLTVVKESKIKQVNPRFTFIQNNPVSDEYREAQYSVWLEDLNGNHVSSDVVINANRKGGDSMEFKVKFSEQLSTPTVRLVIQNMTDRMEEPMVQEFKVRIMFDQVL